MLDKESNKRKYNLKYKIIQWETKVSFDALNDISNHVKLMQLMESIGNENQAVSIVVKWIFDSEYKKTFPLLV